MSGYEYANARLRAMKSRLLGRSDYQRLAGIDTLDHLLTAFVETPYRESVEAALVRGGEFSAINSALSHHLVMDIRKIRGFFDDPERRVVALALRMYDVHNVKAILRGLQNNLPPDEIQSALLPVGDLNEVVLTELTRAADPRKAIDLMASLRLPLARPLMQARSAHTSAEIPALELALDRWYFESAAAELENGPRGSAGLKDALDLEADLANLLTVLRIAHAPSDVFALLERFHAGTLHELFVGPGRVSVETLEAAASQPTVEAAVKRLEDTAYYAALVSGLEAYRTSRRLSELERHLLRYRLEWRARLMRSDPLGPGVVLGYLALKINEIGNLRWVTFAIGNGLAADKIMEGLVLLDE